MSRRPIVLVVENDPVLQRAIRRFLERADYRVLEAVDVHEAVREAARAEHLDAVVAALDVPGPPVEDLAQLVRRLHPRAVIIACASWAKADAWRQVSLGEAGVDACVPAMELNSQLLPALVARLSRPPSPAS